MAEPSEQLKQSLTALRLEPTARPAARRRRRLPLVLAGIAALVLVAMGVRWFGGSRAPQVEVAAATVLEPGRGVPVLSGAGYVVSADRYISIGVRVAGRIDRYLAEEGDRVKQGDPLVRLDDRDYRAAVARAEAAVQLARANAALKQRQVARMRQLGHEGVVSREDLDIREAEAQTAAEAVKQAEAELTQSQVSLEYTTLYAPRTGVILAKLKEVGEIAVPGGFSGSGDLIRMANLDDLRGQVDVTEGELAKVRLQQRAEVIPDAYPDRTYAAHVIKLYPQIDRQKGTLRVEVQIEKLDEYLWPDMSARITFFEEAPAAASGRAILVPRTAVDQRDGAALWVLDGDRVRRRAVTLGGRFGEQVEVAAGITGDELLVVGDTTTLRDGQLVRTAQP